MNNTNNKQNIDSQLDLFNEHIIEDDVADEVEDEIGEGIRETANSKPAYEVNKNKQTISHDIDFEELEKTHISFEDIYCYKIT